MNKYALRLLEEGRGDCGGYGVCGGGWASGGYDSYGHYIPGEYMAAHARSYQAQWEEQGRVRERRRYAELVEQNRAEGAMTRQERSSIDNQMAAIRGAEAARKLADDARRTKEMMDAAGELVESGAFGPPRPATQRTAWEVALDAEYFHQERIERCRRFFTQQEEREEERGVDEGTINHRNLVRAEARASDGSGSQSSVAGKIPNSTEVEDARGTEAETGKDTRIT